MYSNIFYFKLISKIGGTEQFLYEIAKKYNMYDVTIFYDEADENQIKRLRNLVRCKKRVKGEKIKCIRAFLNFNIDIIDDIDAEEAYTFVSHANYEELHKVHGGYIPPIDHPKLTNLIGVSQFSTDKLNEYAKMIGCKLVAQRCYNPLTLEKQKKVKLFVTACRLDDVVKGGARIQILIKEMDKYCEEHPDEHYLLLIFTNPCSVEINSKNVAIMPPRIDVRSYIASADMLFQLSNDMETFGYSINEALGYGVPIVTTPLTILKELPITDNEHIILDWDCGNVKDVVKQIFEKKIKPFTYNPPKDEWDKYLIKNKSIYEEERKMKYLVEATDKYVQTNTFDAERSKEESEKKGENVQYFPQKGEQWLIDYQRKEILVEKGFVNVVKEVEEKTEETDETPVEEEKTEETDETPVEEEKTEETDETPVDEEKNEVTKDTTIEKAIDEVETENSNLPKNKGTRKNK